MDLSLSDDQQQILDAFSRFFERESTPERVRGAEPLGFDAELWKQLTAMGAVEMALPDSGLGLLDAALLCEVAGAHLAPVPLVEALVTTRLLGRDAGGVVTLALHPAEGGTARLVPAGAVADAVVALRGDDLVLVPLDGPREAPPNLGSSPVADCPVEGGEVLASGADAHGAFATALDEWRVLTSAALAGLAGAVLSVAVGYVKQREQFGVAIGSFQTVQHRLADVATAVDGARLVAREAAWSGDPLLASMALLHCARTADDAAAAALHFHGGYGFMLEYDVQLFFRRARAWRLVLGGLDDLAATTADRLFGVR